MKRSLLVLALALSATAFAAPKGKEPLPERSGPRDLGDEPVEDFDLQDAPDRRGPLMDFEDLDGEPPAAAAGAQRKTASAPAPTGPGRVPLEVTGKKPLADNYPLSVVHVERDAVVVELPILVAGSKASVETAFAIIVEVSVDDALVSRATQVVDPASLAEFGPTFAFMKILAPVIDKEGRVTVFVGRAAADGTSPEPLFSRSTPYALP